MGDIATRNKGWAKELPWEIDESYYEFQLEMEKETEHAWAESKALYFPRRNVCIFQNQRLVLLGINLCILTDFFDRTIMV